MVSGKRWGPISRLHRPRVWIVWGGGVTSGTLFPRVLVENFGKVWEIHRSRAIGGQDWILGRSKRHRNPTFPQWFQQYAATTDLVNLHHAKDLDAHTFLIYSQFRRHVSHSDPRKVCPRLGAWAHFWCSPWEWFRDATRPTSHYL